jgi:hypothetical protein
MVSFLENPVIYLVLTLFRKEDKTKLQWTDNDIHLYSPDTPPSCELYPKKRGGSVSPPILKQGTYGMGNLRFPYDPSLS